MANREIPEINAGSMADIAFLLLIFFLVTTTIQSDSGLRVFLPVYVETPPEPVKKNKRNVFSVQINGNNALLVRGTPFPNVLDLKDKLKEFIMNNGKDPNSSSAPDKAIVSLLNDNATSYETYVVVYDQLKGAYNELWDEAAKTKYGLIYENLTKEERALIRQKIPLVISEAEPTSFENN